MVEVFTNPVFLGIACGTVIAVVAMVGGHWSDVRKTEMIAALKQDMVRRGMSADEIKTVIEAGGPKEEAAEESSRSA